MNNTTNKTFPFSKEKCHTLSMLFGEYYTDILILQIYYVFTALTIVISNGLLLHALISKKCKTRPDKLFLIMSSSDVGVGLFSIPLVSLPLFTKHFNMICIFSPAINFFLYCPYMFSWTMVIIIAVDRVFLITKGHIYEKYITMKVLYRLIAFVLVFDFAVGTFVALDKEYLEGIHPLILYTQVFTEISFIGLTVAAYIYLFYFVCSKSKNVNNARHCSIKYSKRLLMTVTYTFMCLVAFTLPQFVGVVIRFVVTVQDPIIDRNLYYWRYILAYSNSYANAIIILYNTSSSRNKSNERSARSIFSM